MLGHTLNNLHHAPPAPAIEHCPVPFLGPTVQPYKEPCGSPAGFEFLSLEN
jgi:hypothetical protein